MNVDVLCECDLPQGGKWGVRENSWHDKKHYPTHLTGSAAYLPQSPACSLWQWVFTRLSYVDQRLAATHAKTHLFPLWGANLASEKHPAASTNGVWSH